MLEHGGRLHAASARYGIALNQWLDLSTGINPQGWPAPALPPEILRLLPEDEDGLQAAACHCYRARFAFPVPGTQAAIQLLPRLRPACRVGVLTPTYAEHALAWMRAGHTVEHLTAERIPSRLHELDVLVMVNPNNPTGEKIPAATLLHWHGQLRPGGGPGNGLGPWLIVDEAFADAEDPALSLAAAAHEPGLIVLRSLGKFFGLAGLRVGFVLAAPALLESLREAQGPWAVNHPARWLATRALRDEPWQQAARAQLARDRLRLTTLLSAAGHAATGDCALFQWIATPDAVTLHEKLARLGVLTRLFKEPGGLRLGLPGAEADWSQLHAALRSAA